MKFRTFWRIRGKGIRVQSPRTKSVRVKLSKISKIRPLIFFWIVHGWTKKNRRILCQFERSILRFHFPSSKFILPIFNFILSTIVPYRVSKIICIEKLIWASHRKSNIKNVLHLTELILAKSYDIHISYYIHGQTKTELAGLFLLKILASKKTVRTHALTKIVVYGAWWIELAACPFFLFRV